VTVIQSDSELGCPPERALDGANVTIQGNAPTKLENDVIVRFAVSDDGIGMGKLMRLHLGNITILHQMQPTCFEFLMVSCKQALISSADSEEQGLFDLSRV
jgi:hypothetical protein